MFQQYGTLERDRLSVFLFEKYMFKKFGFQHREDWMKVETEERSVVEAT